MQVGDKGVGELKNQVAGAPVADAELVGRTDAVKLGNAGPEQRNVQPRRRLTTVGVGQQQVAADGAQFQIFQIADSTSGVGTRVSTGE